MCNPGTLTFEEQETCIPPLNGSGAVSFRCSNPPSERRAIAGYLPAYGRAQLPILNSEILYFISGDVVPSGMGGRGVSPVDAGGSGRSRSGIRLRAENTPLS